MWITPFCGGRKASKYQEAQVSKSSRFYLLRERRRRRAIVRVRIDEPVRDEPDPALVEEEAGREREDAISIRRVFVASAVDPEIVEILESFRMRQKHASYFECAESELVSREDFASPTDTATPVAETELAGNDQDVVALLLVSQRFELLYCALVLSEILRSEFAFAPVVELALALFLDQVKHLLDRFLVGLGNRLPSWDGEPPFSVGWKRLLCELLIGVKS